MRCDICQKEDAEVFLSQIVNGEFKKLNLCPACATKSNEGKDPTGNALTEILNKMSVSETLEKNSGLLKCPTCGFTQADFRKTARLGCSECYSVFHDQLMPMLKNMHKGTVHIGRVPARFKHELERKRRFMDLHERLDKAVAEEEFEMAASLRDEIHQLTNEKASEVKHV
ncbi:MAG: excinuclease ABC subunit B [Chthoniobacterales bacterium]